ncbi:hypothetical protein E2C01_017812 [Portunus trituberculatus]|uniref:Uncharacterized protein n=1 Tax=Portunus trituberculatus TaxID=210409 RepID=A0A5B7DUJ7_PORTR|nr:hypothetical protein [Portunus trituberculatus]
MGALTPVRQAKVISVANLVLGCVFRLHSHSRPDRMAIRRPATATLLMTIPLILSPFLLIPRILEVLQLLPSAVKGVYSHYSHVHTAAQPTTTIPPPVVWFPDLNKECGDGGGGGDGGFSTFSFLAMVVSVVNLISLLHSTANNNNNNNNNNDDNNNVNSANMQAANEDNNNNNLGVLTMVMFGGRRRRDLYSSSSSSSSSSSEDVAAAVGLFFLKAWLQVFGFNSTFTLLHNSTTSFPSTSTLLAPGGVVGRTSGCALLALCEANERSAAFGQLGEDVAEVLSVAFVDHLQEAIVEVKGERERAGLLRAGGRGRTCWRSACCAFHYPCGNS